MLTLTCEVNLRSRPLSGGVRYNLKPVDAQCAIPIDAPEKGPDLDQTHIAIYDYVASQDVLRDLRRNPADMVSADAGGSIITVTTTGSLYVEIFLSESGHSSFLADLDTALEKVHLLASLMIGPEMDGPHRFTLEQWLKGVRFDQDHTIWTHKVPELGLVLRK